MDDFDTIPVRLPSGTKAVVMLPRPFTAADAAHMTKFLALYIEEKDEPERAQASQENERSGNAD